MPDLQRESLDKMVGNRADGQAVFLTGSEEPIPVHGDVDWDDNRDLTVSTSALQIPAGLRNHDQAVITVEGQSVRFFFDGSIPTATKGHQADAGDTIELESRFEVAKFRVIRKDGADSTLRITVGNRA